MEMLGMKQEMMDETMDEMGESDDEEETDAIVDQVGPCSLCPPASHLASFLFLRLLPCHVLRVAFHAKNIF